MLLTPPYVNILTGVQDFCWPKFINQLGQKSAFGRFLSCVGINQFVTSNHQTLNPVFPNSFHDCLFGRLMSWTRYYYDSAFTNFCFEPYDLSIRSTQTQTFFLITFNFCIHFKKENFFSLSVFLSPCQSVLKSRQIFNYITKSIFGFSV
mgnify:CR=1 FL=1